MKAGIYFISISVLIVVLGFSITLVNTSASYAKATSKKSSVKKLAKNTARPAAAKGYCLTVPVLMYHHIQPTAVAQEKKQTALNVDNGVFDQHMAYLVNSGYTPISAQDLVMALKNKTGLPPKSIVVTIDDGYRDNYDYAFPILKKYNIRANIMLSTGLMEGPDYLTWSQVEEMGKSGLISYSNHTWSHANVGGTNAEKIRYEIQTATKQIEDHTGQKQVVFTYPYGSVGGTVITILQENGFIGALSTLPGTYQCDSYIMSLHRTRVGNAPLSFYGI